MGSCLVTFPLLTLTSAAWAGLTCFIGIVLAEFSMSDLATMIAPLSPLLSPPVAIFALVLMSYPNSSPSAAPWSAFLEQFGKAHFGQPALERMYGSIGGILLVACIIISPHARWALSQKPLKWLGKVSFAIYLLHGTFMRTVFAWFLFFGSEKQQFQKQVSSGNPGENDIFEAVWKYPVPGAFRCFVATVALLASTLAASQLWNMKVEPFCAKLTALAEKLVTGQLSSEETLNVSDKQPILPTRRD